MPTATELGGANGMTDFTARTVQIRVDMDDAAMVKCLAHERAHVALGHGDRGREGVHRGIGEVEAASVAMVMVTSAYGMDTSGYTVPYVSAWSTTVTDAKPVDVVRAVGERVRKTALTILDGLPEPSIGDGNPPGLKRHTYLAPNVSAAPGRELEDDVRPAPTSSPATAVSL